MKWEYRVVEYKDQKPEVLFLCLKAQGDEGFELVQVEGTRYYFKRPKS